MTVQSSEIRVMGLCMSSQSWNLIRNESRIWWISRQQLAQQEFEWSNKGLWWECHRNATVTKHKALWNDPRCWVFAADACRIVTPAVGIHWLAWSSKDIWNGQNEAAGFLFNWYYESCNCQHTWRLLKTTRITRMLNFGTPQFSD